MSFESIDTDEEPEPDWLDKLFKKYGRTERKQKEKMTDVTTEYPNREWILNTIDKGCDPVRVFRQAGGCLEITQPGVKETDDIIHICTHEVEFFVRQITTKLEHFVDNTPPLH